MKLADTPPSFCAACHCQQSDKKHVDFEAYWDGPVIDGLTGKQPIDDLVLCQPCLEAGAMLIGMVNNKEMRRENYELGKAIEEKDAYIEKVEKMISDLEHTLGLSLSGRVRRGKGKPKVVIPDQYESLVTEGGS